MSPVYLLSQLIDRASQADPDREAISDGTERLNYGQLVERANRLAHLLVDEGVRRGDRVGIFLPRCVDTAVAVHGILKAGAAFVPIDPKTPSGGLGRLLSECGIRHLISQDNLVSRLLAPLRDAAGDMCVVGPSVPVHGARCRPWTDMHAYDGLAGPDLRILSDDLAYIMYSSGSTGRPKGIMHTHRSGLAYAELSVDTYGVAPADRIGNHSPLHFDMSTFGYFSGPFASATTVIIPEAHTKLVASLSELIERERVTIWYSVPLALIQLLLRGGIEGRDLGALRWVLFGGEPFPADHLRTLMSKLPGARFSNVYGPAEVNQCAFYHVPPLTDAACEVAHGQPIPIGEIWENTEALVVDQQDRPVASGEAGELLVRSATMMRGYWGRPDLDAQSFYRPEWIEGPPRVFYRTGDLVRRRDDGQLMFLGRKDRQVKVRGYRVELDDVEHALGTHASVEESAVFAVCAADGTKSIEAALTLRADRQASDDELRTYLGQTLSWYAVPQRISILSTLPRTGTDKIDRTRLQAEAEAARGRR